MNKPWAGVAMISACAWVSGCLGRHREPMPPLGPTLEIVNESSLVYRVTVSPTIVVQVHPGESKCVRVGMYHEVRTIEVIALASTVPYYTPPENLMSASGWVVEIGQLPLYDLLSLRPAEPCKA